MTDVLLHLLFAVAVLIICYVLLVRFSPDPTLTLICQILLFLAAVWVVVKLVLPLVGI
jgi:membrane associated rhomboid family serine protease